jgi:superoxide dismutase
MGIAGRKVEVCAQTKPRQYLAWVVAEHLFAMDVWEHALYLNIKTEDQITSKLFQCY